MKMTQRVSCFHHPKSLSAALAACVFAACLPCAGAGELKVSRPRLTLSGKNGSTLSKMALRPVGKLSTGKVRPRLNHPSRNLKKRPRKVPKLAFLKDGKYQVSRVVLSLPVTRLKAQRKLMISRYIYNKKYRWKETVRYRFLVPAGKNTDIVCRFFRDGKLTSAGRVKGCDFVMDWPSTCTNEWIPAQLDSMVLAASASPGSDRLEHFQIELAFKEPNVFFIKNGVFDNKLGMSAVGTYTTLTALSYMR